VLRDNGPDRGKRDDRNQAGHDGPPVRMATEQVRNAKKGMCWLGTGR